MYDPEYQKKWVADNQDKVKGYQKKYRDNNRSKLKERYAVPENKVKKNAQSKSFYELNGEKVRSQQAVRRKERRVFIGAIAIRYGCQNPDCKWQGCLEPYQLCFHHIDPSQKDNDVGSMGSWSFDRIVDEMNKCVVFCKNCHPLADRGLITITENMMCKVLIDEVTSGPRNPKLP
jgi:hypothetical protein